MNDYTDSDREQANWREIDRLRATVKRLESAAKAEAAAAQMQYERANAAESAIARVRELMDLDYWSGRERLAILRALDGGTE